MKKLYPILVVTALVVAGCSETINDGVSSSDAIMFGLADNVVTKASTSADSDIKNAGPQIYSVPMQSDEDADSSLYLITTIEDNTQNPFNAVTRGAMITSFSSFGWFAVDNSNPSTLAFDNQETTGYTGNIYSTGQYWPLDVLSGGKAYSFFAYYPYLSTSANGLTLDTSNKTITYDVTSPSIANQQDLMVAYASTGYNGGAAVPLTFKHACTAIKFKTSSDFGTSRKIKKVELLDVYTNGICTMGGVAPHYVWNLSSKSNYTIYEDATGIDGNGVDIISDSDPLFMIPQNLTAPSQMVRVTFDDATTLTADLKGSIWEAGRIVTYAISPTAITGLKTLTVDYPLWKNSSEVNVYGPVFRYENEDFFGLFAVNTSTNKVTKSNVRVGVSFGSTTATCNLSGIETLPETGHAYYIMYPYRESVTGAPTVGDDVTADATADQFFANVITNWTVSGTQNTFATHKEQDLQIAKATIAGTSASAKMVHKMGLAKVALGTKSVATSSVRTYSSQSTHNVYTTTSENVDITATSHLDATSELRLLDASSITGEGGLWTIVKPGDSVILNSVSFSDDDDAWSSSITASVTAGHYQGYTASSGRSTAIAFVANFEYNDQKTYYQIELDPGTYKLEAWGAQGGDGRMWNQSTIVADVGGKGGYTSGILTLDATTTLYVCVGGKGEQAYYSGKDDEYTTYNVRPKGGYNGGGRGGTETTEGSPENAGGGGGATHIATSLQGTGVLSAYVSHKNDVLIVAGGGGGAAGDFPENYAEINVEDSDAISTLGTHNLASYGLEDNLRASLQAFYGGEGGSIGAGTTYHFGNSSVSTSICGVRPCSCPGVAENGDDTYFGKGQDGCTYQTDNIGGTGGGGGGWYGGTYGGHHRNAVSAGGAGGSGHVHASLTNPGGIVGARSGNGYARITKL